MTIDRGLKVGVVSSLVAAVIFLYLLDPILSFVSRTGFRVANALGSWYIDRFFAEIAAGPTEYAYLLNEMVCAWALLIVSTPLAIGLRKRFRAKPVDPDATKKEGRKTHLGAAFALSILVFFIVLFIVADGFARLRIRSSFEQHVTILSPLLDPQDVLRLRADFAAMERKADYDRLRQQINAYASNHHVKLPPNKLYPWFE
jgi:hypothetical protein